MKGSVIIKGMAAWLLVVIALAGCSKDDDVPPEAKKLSFDSEEVLAKLPDGLKNSTDEYAESCMDFIESALDMTGFIDQMEVPDDAQKSTFKGSAAADTWEWTWSYQGETITFYWSYEETGGKRYWTMDISYNNSPRYNYIDAWETMEGDQGEVIWNFGWTMILDGETYNDAEFLYWKYTWNRDSSGNYTINYTWDGDDGEYTFYIRYDLQVNADGSGTIDYYLMDELFYHMEWDVLGNGSWIYYFGGDTTMSGTWAAG